MKKFSTLLFACLFSLLALTSSPANAGEVRQILKDNGGWNIYNITMRDAPTINGAIIREINTWGWPYDEPDIVELTGNTENGWAEILFPTNEWCDEHGRSHCRQARGWILGEFVGILPENSKYVEFTELKELRTTHGNALGRLGPTILAPFHVHGYYHTFDAGDDITVIGKQGHWLHILKINGELHFPPLWIYDELVEPAN